MSLFIKGEAGEYKPLTIAGKISQAIVAMRSDPTAEVSFTVGSPEDERYIEIFEKYVKVEMDREYLVTNGFKTVTFKRKVL